MPWDVDNKTMSFFPIKAAFLVRAQENKIVKILGEAKNIFFIPLSYWRSKRLALSGFQTWSQNWAWVIFDPVFFSAKPQKIVEISIPVYFGGFSANIGWVKYYPKLNSETMFGIFPSSRTF